MPSPIGSINWANLLNYNIQPSDMALFQSYARQPGDTFRQATRGTGIISGGVITPVTGLSVKVSAGVAIMPNGTIAAWPDLTATLSPANATLGRFDRIELMVTPTNNTQVQDVNSQAKTLDILNVVSVNVVAGTPAASPAIPAQTTGNLSLGYISVTAGMTLVTAPQIFQPVDTALQISALQLGNGGWIRFNSSLGQLQYSNNGGLIWQVIGSGGGGGGGGAVWQGVQGSAPIESFELDEKSFKFAQGNGEAISLFVRVPDNYIAGSPIKLRLGHYAVTGSNAFRFQATATLIRRGTDAFNSTTNQYQSTNGDTAEVGPFVYQEVVYDLSTAGGLINGLTPSPYDMIKITLTRATPTATEDTGDVAVVPSTTEVLFA